MQTLFGVDWREIWRGQTVPESGTVYTKPEIVDLILDLVGYLPSKKRLLDYRLLEPSCGDGAFLKAIAIRLVESEKRAGPGLDWASPRWANAIMAVDIDPTAVAESRRTTVELLSGYGCPETRAREIADIWVNQTDFLLHDWGQACFDFVVGNPPYVRPEAIPQRVLAEYRHAWRTATDRADLYIPFFECGLARLSRRGALAFICANRFAKNQYGGALRRLIAGQYHVRHYINLEHTQPFLSKVSAYPAVIVLDRRRGSATHAVTVDDLEPGTLNALRKDSRRGAGAQIFEAWYPDGAPWISTSRTRQASLESLARDYPTIEESAPGTRVGIGIATGADDVYILPARDARIEADRQVPLLMARDISNAGLAWSGRYLVNPFSDVDDGSLVSFQDYPCLGLYLQAHASLLKSRHCAKSREANWYRTIDRYWPKLTGTPKLVIPDIQPGGVIGYDPGGLYPHHNVYWITSPSWDLRELQNVLQSDMVTDQLRAFSVSMRGGSLRYQAQNLRRIRIPAP